MAEDLAPISLAQAETIPQEPINIDTGVLASPVTPEVASVRAEKAQYGLADVLAKDYNEFYRRFISGEEPNVRKEAAAAMDYKKAMALNQIVKQTAEKYGPLTPDDYNHIRNTVQRWKPEDPNSVIEDAFSGKAVNNIYTVNSGLNPTEDRPYSFLEDAMRLIPNTVAKTVREGSVYSSKIEFAKTLRGNVQADIDNQTYVGWTLDQAKMLLQPYLEAKLRGNVPIDVWGGLGTSKEEQAKALLRMPPDEYKKRLTAIVNSIKKDNPALAASFLESVIGESGQSINLDNAFTLLAIPDAFTVGNLARKGILAAATRKAVKDVVTGLDNVANQPVKAVVANAAGDLTESAIQRETAEVLKGMRGAADPATNAIEQLADVMKTTVKNVEKDPGRGGQEVINRIRESYNNFQASLFDTIQRISKVDRITPVLATETAMRALQQEIKDTYRGFSDAILNISSVYKKDLTNTYHADIVIGNPNGGFFLQRENAEAYARFSGISINAATDIKQQGLGFYIAVTKPVNETSHVVRDFLTATAASKSPNSWFSAFAGMLRTPEETLAHEQLMNRKVATYAPSELMKVAKETAKEIENLQKWTLPFTGRRERWNEWQRAVKYAQDAIDPDFIGPLRAGEGKGYFFKTPAELETFYQQNFKRLPQGKEVEAYYAFKRLGEMDHVLRNLSIYRNMSRVGAENHVFQTLDASGKVLRSDTFQGVIRKEFPGGEGTIMVVGEKQGAERLFNEVNKPSTKALKELREGVRDGRYKVIELYDPELRPFNGFGAVGEQRVRYVVAKNVETDALRYDSLPYKGGGHFEYDYEHYIKQANVRIERVGKSVKHIYEGDQTITAVPIRAMGHDAVQKMNAARLAFRNKDIDKAKEIVKGLPFEWSEFSGWFKQRRDPVTKKLSTPHLNVNEPFVLVPRGGKISELDNSLPSRYTNRKGQSTFEDGTRKGSLARQYQVQYTGERDAINLQALQNKGTQVNPLYQLGDATLLDPIPTMNRALSRITHSFFMDDYKISAVEHWLKEAQPFLQASASELHYAPFHHFNTLSANAWHKNAPPEMVKQLTTRWNQIRQFTGTASETEALVHSFSQKLADSIYAKFGPEGLKVGGYTLDPAEILSKRADPVKFVRSLAFHAKLGLFAIPQFLVQSQTYVMIMGIAGFSKAAPGTFGAMLHQWSRVNPAMIDSLDKWASRLHIPGTSRWRPGEFKEAWQELKNTGFANVAGEYALRDDLMTNKVISSQGRNFLDAGTFFFTEGEKNVRLGAWYTAYREFRDANPLGKITDVERKAILDRAALLNVNMDRSSNSILQHGVFSIPMQFLTYQIRAAELFMGKRLSAVEKARLFGFNAALYGVPTATGLVGYPFGDHMRKAAVDRGYQANEGWYSSLMEGLPAYIAHAATGNSYNIGERYGNQGFTSLRDALNGDKTLWDLMGGAAGSTLSNTWTQSDGFRTAVMSYIKGDPGFKMKPSDAADIFKEISSFNSAWRLWAALNTGRWMTKGEQWASDVTPLNAVMQTVTGLQDQRLSDARTKTLLRKDEKALAEYSEKKFVEEFQRGMREEDPNQKQNWMGRAFTWLKIGGYPENRYGQAISKAVQDNENLIQRTDWNWATKDVPQAKKGLIPFTTRDNIPQQRMEDYGRSLQGR